MVALACRNIKPQRQTALKALNAYDQAGVEKLYRLR